MVVSGPQKSDYADVLMEESGIEPAKSELNMP
jgi:hypothetical protein